MLSHRAGGLYTRGRFIVAVLCLTILAVSETTVLRADQCGALSFGAPTKFNVGQSPVPMVTVDFNKDGKLDLATVNQLSETVSVLLGNGSGGFSSPLNFSVGKNPFSIVAGDFNRDTRPDLAVG